MSSKKEVEALIRKLKKAGWECRRTRNNHWQVKPPNGGQLIVAGTTSSDVNAVKNFKAALKRAGFEDK